MNRPMPGQRIPYRRLRRVSRDLERLEDRISRALGLLQPFRLCLLDEASAVYLTAEDRERLEKVKS